MKLPIFIPFNSLPALNSSFNVRIIRHALRTMSSTTRQQSCKTLELPR